MKLILANNQSPKFKQFYADLHAQSDEGLRYAGYQDVLFKFDTTAPEGTRIACFVAGSRLQDFDGVYINGYLSSYESAAAVAIACEAIGIPYVNKELANPPSLSKLTGYAKLAAAGVSIPVTYAGAQAALLQALRGNQIKESFFPCVLKRADADRGIDNFKVHSLDEALEKLAAYEARSSWVLQQFVPNDGYYLVSYYDNQPVFGIFRSLETRPDGDAQKAHMYKPKGGANASYIEPTDVPVEVANTCKAAVVAMNRQVGSVDCLFDTETGQTYVLEVNYNPQLVTIETFKQQRTQAMLDFIDKKWYNEDMTTKTTIGRAEKVTLAAMPAVLVPAKIDTGADISSIWASNCQETPEGLQFTLFGEGSPLFTGEVLTVAPGKFHTTLIANSFGTKELRYVIDLELTVLGKQVTVSCSLADRSSKLYPMLLGRSLLKQGFVVDVTAGEPLKEQEKQWRAAMQAERKQLEQES